MRPDFIIIGAMKCATTTLHEQLAAQPGVFMSKPKEPCFFSDDDVWSRGIGWYESLFRDAPVNAICGESSTHYTKLPTYPKTIDRVRSLLPDVRLIYVMRHPVERLISHFVHDWSEGILQGSIDEAVERHAVLLQYSRYAYQIRPWIDAFGADGILPMFQERMKLDPDGELQRVAQFIGFSRTVAWQSEQRAENVSSERLRKGPLLSFLMDTPVISHARRALVPRSAREWVKNRFFRMRQRPTLGEVSRARVERIFDADLAELSDLLAFDQRMTCTNFADVACSKEDPRFRRTSKPATMTPVVRVST